MTEKGASEHRKGERERENICTCSSQMLGNGLQPFSRATVGLRQDSLSVYASLGNSGKLLTLRLHRPGSKMIDVSVLTEKREICGKDDRSQQFAKKATDKNQQHCKAVNMTIVFGRETTKRGGPSKSKEHWNEGRDIPRLLKASRYNEHASCRGKPAWK